METSVPEMQPVEPLSHEPEPPQANPTTETAINKCLSSTFCSVALGVLLTLFGVAVTVFMFHNQKAENKVFPVGPLLVVAGLLSTGKALLHHRRVMEQRRRLERRRRRLSRVRASHTTEPQQRADEGAICLGPPSFDEIPYDDDMPPAYEVVASDNCCPPYVAGNVRMYSTVAVQTNQHGGATNMALVNDADDLLLLPPQPPPSYEEVVRAQQEVTSTASVAQDNAPPPPEHNV